MTKLKFMYLFSIEQRLTDFYKSSIENEDERKVKPIIINILRNMGQIIDMDKELRDLIFCNLRNKITIKPDLILLYSGENIYIPKFLPIEIDLNQREVERHLPKLFHALPISMEIIPESLLSMVDSKIRIYARKVIHNIIIGSVSIARFKESSEESRIKINFYSLYQYENIVRYLNIKFLRDIKTSLINLLKTYSPNFTKSQVREKRVNILKEMLECVNKVKFSDISKLLIDEVVIRPMSNKC